MLESALEALTGSGVQTLTPGLSEREEVWDTIIEAALIADGQPAALNAHHGLRLQRTFDAVIRSIHTGQTVKLADTSRQPVP